MLQSIKLSVIVCVILLCLSACKNRSSEAHAEKLSVKPLQEKDIAVSVFQMLQQLDTLSLNTYKNYLVSYKDIQTIAADTNYKIGTYYRKDLKRIKETEHNSITRFDLQNLKSIGKQFHIEWNSIKYQKYIAQPQEIDGGKILLHETHFSDLNNKTYFVKTAALFDGKGYYLLKVAELEVVRANSN